MEQIIKFHCKLWSGFGTIEQNNTSMTYIILSDEKQIRKIYILSTLDSYVKQKCINFINGLTHTISSFAVIYLVNHRVTFGCRMWKQAPWDKICRAKCILRLPKRNFFSSNSIHMPHCHHLVSYANHNSFIYCQKAIQIAS